MEEHDADLFAEWERTQAQAEPSGLLNLRDTRRDGSWMTCESYWARVERAAAVLMAGGQYGPEQAVAEARKMIDAIERARAEEAP